MAQVTVNFYICSDDDKKLNKSKFTTLYSGIKVDWVENTSMLKPSIKLANMKNLMQANYMYIQEFNRYYFLDPPILILGNMIRIDTKEIDVLYSWASYIRNISTLIERQEFVWSPFIIDPELPTRTPRIITTRKLGNIGNPSGSYIALTVTGGNDNV